MRRWHGAVDMRRGSLAHPHPVLIVLYVCDWGPVPLLFSRAHPFVRFGMTVPKSKSASPVMIGSGTVKPLGMFHAIRERRVIEIIQILVDQYPQHRWTRRDNIRKLAVSTPRFIAPMILLVVQPGTIDRKCRGPGMLSVRIEGRTDGSDRLAHRKAARGGHHLSDVERVSTLIFAGAFISRAVED